MDCKTAQSLVIPYINDQLSDEETEDFLEHIENCKECYEELEIHFTVHYALQKLDEDDKIHVIEKDDLELGYRTSIIAKKGYTVLGAEIELQEGEKEAIRTRMNELKEKRVTKQPLEYPSAGSTFKRPEGYFAGKLVQDAGLRGFRVGDAMVSEKHCGFVINAGEATAAQVDELMKQVSAKVREQFGVTLEPEVKRLGEF